MPITPTYPGVYIEEIPGGGHPITGVSTSIAAFIGRARRGPVNTPVMVRSFAEFERTFGGLWIQSTLGFAVQDFYLNGGVEAVIVRLYHAPAEGMERASATLDVGALALRAASPGTWGNSLRARVEHAPSSAGVEADTLFDLTIRDGETAAVETFRGVSIRPSHPRRIDDVLRDESELVRVAGELTDTTPRPAASAAAAPGQDRWADNQPPTSYKVLDAALALDGGNLTTAADFTPSNAASDRRGLYALASVDLFNVLCIPPYLAVAEGDVEAALISEAAAYCESRRAMLLVDPRRSWARVEEAKNGVGTLGTSSRNAAFYFPCLRRPNPVNGNTAEDFVPCGAIAGVFARNDARRGVWKAPAGPDATLLGVPDLAILLTDQDDKDLNPLGINCLRVMPSGGPVVWGARTLQGSDAAGSAWKYVPIRRMALFLEESIDRGTRWAAFEPNDEPLWTQMRQNVGAFMHSLFRQGAFQGMTPQQAFFVKCDRETTTQADIGRGRFNIVVGFAPLKPAEFVIFRIQQTARQA